MNPIIRFEHISKGYNLGLSRISLPGLVSQSVRNLKNRTANQDLESQYLWALHDISFTLGKGESLALVGQNGAGKTTILKLLSRITMPTSGKIETKGRLSALIELGAGFHPDLTGRENIYLNGTILGLKRKDIDRQFDEIVAFSELERFIDTPVKRYSSGMAVRLGFAVASSIDPDILLVDEVLAVGDASFQQKCLKRIQSLLDKGTSIIFVSHNLYLVQAVCSSALYIKKGELTLHGATKDVITAYERDLHRERAQKFVNQSQMSENQIDSFEITRVEIYGTNQDGDNVLHSEKTAEICVHYEALNDIGDVNVAAYIIRSDGLTCCMMRTSLDHYLLSIQRGKGVLKIVLDPLQVISGTYFIEVYFLNASDSMIIKSTSSDWFDVSGAALSYEDRSGVFQPHTTWNHNMASSETH